MDNLAQNGLEIYAKIEHLLGVREVSPKLYKYYFDILKNLQFNSLIDIGCGSGTFLQLLNTRIPNKRYFGIDKSVTMVERTLKLGFQATNDTLDKIETKFQVATATFDMVNYLDSKEIKDFFQELSNVVDNGGLFVFDINTEFALSQLAVGSFSAQDESNFIAIESFYDHGIYESEFTLFEQTGELYKKSFGVIKQYLYTKEFFEKLDGWKLVDLIPINLYDMGSIDKQILVMQR